VKARLTERAGMRHLLVKSVLILLKHDFSGYGFRTVTEKAVENHRSFLKDKQLMFFI